MSDEPAFQSFTALLQLPVRVHEPACPEGCKFDHVPGIVLGFGITTRGEPMLLVLQNGRRPRWVSPANVDSPVSVSFSGLLQGQGPGGRA